MYLDNLFVALRENLVCAQKFPRVPEIRFVHMLGGTPQGLAPCRFSPKPPFLTPRVSLLLLVVGFAGEIGLCVDLQKFYLTWGSP